jgi:integrase
MSAGASSPGQVLEPYGAARLLRAAAERGGGLHTFVRLSLTSGARRGELLEVRWPDLCWPDAVGGCGMLSVMCRNDGKTARARRRIAIDPGTMDVLAAWRSESCAAVRATGLDPQGCVFAADMPGESARNPGRVTRQVTALAAQTGVSAGVAGLRRYGMTRMIVLGVPEDVIAHRFGLGMPASRMFWPAESFLAADAEAVLALADELDQAVAGIPAEQDG